MCVIVVQSLVNVNWIFKMVNILITGSRTWENKEVIEKALENCTQNDFVIHGGAIGADSIAELYCKKHGIPTKIIRPINHQRISYLYRNVEMIGMCDVVFAFWDGKSTGTAMTVNYARLRKKPVKMYNIG